MSSWLGRLAQSSLNEIALILKRAITIEDIRAACSVHQLEDESLHASDVFCYLVTKMDPDFKTAALMVEAGVIHHGSMIKYAELIERLIGQKDKDSAKVVKQLIAMNPIKTYNLDILCAHGAAAKGRVRDNLMEIGLFMLKTSNQSCHSVELAPFASQHFLLDLQKRHLAEAISRENALAENPDKVRL